MEISENGGRLAASRAEEGVPARGGGLPHLRWELEQVMTRVKPNDLSADEIAGLLGILRPAHSRVIGGPTGRPGLHLAASCSDQATPQLA